MATEQHKTDRLRRIRALHRDIGFFVVGLTVVYALRFLLKGVRMQCGRDLANGPRIPNAWR